LFQNQKGKKKVKKKEVKKMKRAVLGKFTYIDDVEKAIDELLKAGYKREDIQFISSFPVEEIIEKLGGHDSPVKFSVLTGGTLGFLSAIGLVLLTSLAYILPVGGKPVVAWIPYVIVMFELTVLLGSIFNLLGLIFFSKLPDIFLFFGWRPFLPSFTDDKFGLVVITEKVDDVKAILQRNGAEEVRDYEA
jgi:molybdopterin-containing oxidoreductase family membrane subunit